MTGREFHRWAGYPPPPRRWEERRASRARQCLALLTLVLTACSVPIATEVGEEDANRIVVRLGEAGIEATKRARPGATGSFSVSVNQSDASRALALMVKEPILTARQPGLEDALWGDSLALGAESERQRIALGIAGELQESLLLVDGVETARVHLVLPSRSRLGARPPEPPRASVLIRQRTDAAPLAEAEVARFVAGAVPELDPEQVILTRIALDPRPPTATAVPAAAIPYGPLILTLVGLNFALLSALGFLWRRTRREHAGVGADTPGRSANDHARPDAEPNPS